MKIMHCFYYKMFYDSGSENIKWRTLKTHKMSSSTVA